MGLAPGKFFAKFLEETKGMTPQQRAAAVTYYTLLDHMRSTDQLHSVDMSGMHAKG
jgi:hypothetical protein